MFRKKDDSQSDNFWISYADLMAGLLFVFILLIGAIVSKSIIMREDLRHKESSLTQAHREIDITKKSLKEKERLLQQKIANLNRLKRELKKKDRELRNKRYAINKQSRIIKKQKKEISKAKHTIKLKEEEVRKLHILLAQLKLKLKKEKNSNSKLKKELSTTRAKLQTALEDNNKTKTAITLKENELKLREDDLKTLNQILLARNAKIDELNKKVIILQNLLKKQSKGSKRAKIQKYVNKVIVLSGKLTKLQDELRLKDKKLMKLLEALDEQKTQYDELIAKLQKQKAKIKTLTGIRLKVIAALKETLGKKIDIDKKTGSLRLSSNILFDKGSAKLKDESKEELRKIFEDYIAALMSNRAIKPHLDRIVIEGHTDSDGGYLYNLELSQKRALAVMNYLLTLPVSKKYNLKRYLVASGRAYLDPIMKNGNEDKDASRRIEIKFRLKNQDAMNEIERILDEGR